MLHSYIYMHIHTCIFNSDPIEHRQWVCLWCKCFCVYYIHNMKAHNLNVCVILSRLYEPTSMTHRELFLLASQYFICVCLRFFVSRGAFTILRFI